MILKYQKQISNWGNQKRLRKASKSEFTHKLKYIAKHIFAEYVDLRRLFRTRFATEITLN